MDEMQCSTKCCTGCGETKLATTDFFPRHPDGVNGLGARCKACVAAYMRKWEQNNRRSSGKKLAAWKEADELLAKGLKKCKACERELPATVEYFGKEKQTRDRFKAKCKDCTRDYLKRWYEEHKEEQAERRKAYSKEYRERPENKARYKAYLEEYKKTERGRALRKARKAKRVALERNADGSHNAADILRMFHDQAELCAYCGRELQGEWTVDHMIPLSRGGGNGWDNLAVTCVPCNLRKHTRTVEEFLDPQ